MGNDKLMDKHLNMGLLVILVNKTSKQVVTFFNFQWEAYYALNSLQIFIAVVQGVVAIIASVTACRSLCCFGTKVSINKPWQIKSHNVGLLQTF